MTTENNNVNNIEATGVNPTVDSGATEQVKPTQENTTVEGVTEKVQENPVEGPTSPVDNQGNINTQVDNKNATTDQPDASNKTSDEVDDLKRKLEEYRLKEEELKNLSQRLGTDKQGDVQIAAAYQQLDIVNNQAQQAYIQLCNEFGVDYRPDKIEASAKELLEKNPQGYYDLQYRLNQLDTIVENKRAEVGNFIHARQMETARAKYEQVLNASPAIANAMNAYLGANQGYNPIELMDNFMELATPMYREAFEYGKLYAQQEAMKANNQPANILNNSTIVNNSGYTAETPKIFTRTEIANMDDATFAKYEKEIDRQVKAGLIK